MAETIEFVAPGFGTAVNAAVLVLTVGDSEGGGLEGQGVRYRVNFAVRTSSAPNLAPAAIGAGPGFLDQSPAWSPDGKELLFERRVPGTGVSRIYRDSVVRTLPGAPAPLTGGTDSQYQPDWSPRGDWIAFTQDSAGGAMHSAIWLYEAGTGATLQLTNRPGLETSAAFEPNGQRIAYAHYPIVGGGVQDRWELRQIALSGGAGTDVALVAGPAGSSEIRSVRWSRDGLWVYFVRNDSLYAIRRDGGAVYSRDSLIPRVSSFDFHVGGDRMVAEEPRTFTFGACPPEPPPVQMPTRRLVLRDSLSGFSEWTASERRFWRTGASFYSPRWSFDGTSVAFSSDQNLADDLDLFHGRVTQDRAPTFVGLQDDYVIYEGETFVLQLQATDPDGQSLSFESPALYLPSGSIFDPQNGRFTWGYPLGAGSEFYVVFRALDGTGGVANRVVRLMVELGGGSGGCPFADTRSPTGWREENSILGRSLTGALALDAYRLKYAPAINNGRIQVRLRENEQENTTLDRVRLVAVDHLPDVRAFAMGEKMVLGTRSPAHRVTSSSAGDITSSVDGTGGFYWGSPGETLYVEMIPARAAGTFGSMGTQDDPGGGGTLEGDPKEMEAPFSSRQRTGLPMSALDEAILRSTGIRVEVSDGAGGWRLLTHYYPRRYRDAIAVDSLGKGPCRLIFVGRHRLYFVGRILPASTAATPQVLTLLSARHSRLGNQRDAVSGLGGATTALVPGDTLGLEFATDPVPEGMVRDYFLLTTGVYVAAEPLLQKPIAPEVPLPTAFALHQNQPNPFDRTTMVRFELPVASPVLLEVFDVQGRRVAVLASAEFPAGFHAVPWDGRDVSGTPGRPGIYVYRLVAGTFRAQKKMMLFE